MCAQTKVLLLYDIVGHKSVQYIKEKNEENYETKLLWLWYTSEFFIFSSSVCCFCFFSLYCAPSTALNAFVGSGYCAIVCEAQLLRLVRFYRAFSYNWLCHSAVSPLTASPHYTRLNTFPLALRVFVCSSHTVLIVRTSTRSENIWYTFMFEN